MMRNFSVGLFLTCSEVFLTRLQLEIFNGLIFQVYYFDMALSLYKFGKGIK